MSDELAVRVAELERRVRNLEHSGGGPTTFDHDPDVFWALAGLKERLPDGGVLFTGAVTLPTGENFEWQHGAPASQLLDLDWTESAPDLAATLGALGHAVRLLIVGLVLTGTRSVAELQRNEALGTSGQLYHHVRQLVAAGWLRSIGRGQYTVPPERVIPLLVVLAAARR